MEAGSPGQGRGAEGAPHLRVERQRLDGVLLAHGSERRLELLHARVQPPLQRPPPAAAALDLRKRSLELRCAPVRVDDVDVSHGRPQVALRVERGQPRDEGPERVAQRNDVWRESRRRGGARVVVVATWRHVCAAGDELLQQLARQDLQRSRATAAAAPRRPCLGLGEAGQQGCGHDRVSSRRPGRSGGSASSSLRSTAAPPALTAAAAAARGRCRGRRCRGAAAEHQACDTGHGFPLDLRTSSSRAGEAAIARRFECIELLEG